MDDSTVSLTKTRTRTINTIRPEAKIHLAKKSLDFQKAMERYHNTNFYKNTGFIVSFLVIFLQITSVVLFYMHYQETQISTLLLAFVAAYIITDFINGLAHMIMDNNTHYHTRIGPFIAAFHLHHLSPRYTDRNPVSIYFFESGTKVWLVLYLLGINALQYYGALPTWINFCIVCIGVLSSWAEVSHYWCHNAKPNQRVIQFLQKNKILLSKSHHLLHHTEDNQSYAFLNGITNPLINWIARRYYKGYKSYSDLHAKAYKGQQTNNRN